MCERNELEGPEDKEVRADALVPEERNGCGRLLRPSLPEKVCRHEWSAGYRRFLKRESRRLMRRLVRMNPEEAPTKKKNMGWSI